MNNWNVVYTEQAERDLREIFEYIAFSLLEPETAQRQAGRIMTAVSNLNHIPLRLPLYDKEPWRSKGLRILPVDNYITIYLPIEERKIVTVIRIMYGGRNIDEILRIDDDI